MINYRPKALSLLPIILFLGLISPLFAAAQVYKTTEGHVEYDSSVPLHSFTGRSDYLTGQIDLSEGTVDFYVDLATIKTGIGARDKDMLETLQTKSYPFAEFYGKLASPFDTLSMGPQQVAVSGDFKVHGVSRTTRINGVLQKTREGLKVTAAWKLNIKDFDIEPPGILFYRVSEIQSIRIEALLTPTPKM